MPVQERSELVEALQAVPDPRRQCQNLRHPLADVLALGFCGVLCGCDDFVEIEEFARSEEALFRRFLGLPHGVPSHDTFRRVFQAVCPQALQRCLIDWLQGPRQAAPPAAVGGEVIAIDGKVLRRTFDRARGLGALHLVSAWAAANGLTLGQVAVGANSNETTAIPRLIELLDLQGCVVTIDAAGCQKDIAAQIVAKDADYVLALKENQPALYEQVADCFLEQVRPGLQRLLALAKARQIDGVVVDDLDRLARLDLLELGVLLSPLRKAGVWVESVAQGRMDYHTMAGRIMLGIGGEAKRTEQLATARRVLTSHIERARERGRPPLAKTAFGYRRETIPGTTVKAPPVIDEAAAEVVRSLFRWYAEGHSLGWIVKELHRRGVASPLGRPRWLRTSVRQVLKNPVYVGRRAWGKTSQGQFYRQKAGRIEQAGGSRKAEWHSPENWFTTDDTPAIIDGDTWDAAQRRLARNAADPNAPRGRDGRARGRAPSSPTTEPGAFLLSGVLVCGRCGGAMVGFHTPKRCRPGIVYVCREYNAHGTAVCVRVQAEEGWAVKQVIAELRKGLLLPERLEWLTEQLQRKAREQRTDGSLARLRKAVDRLTTRLDRERRRLMEVSRDMVGEAESAIRQTRAELEAAQKALRDAETADPVRDLKITAEAARKALWLLETALEGNNRCLLKEALRGVLAGVVIGAEPYRTRTGRTRRRPRIDGISLRPGSGLDTLSLLSASSWASTR